VATWEGGLDYYASGFLAVVQSVEQGALVDPVLANARIGEFKERFAVLLEGADRAATETYESAEHAVSDIPRDLTRLNQVVAITVLAAALLAMVLSISVPRSVSRPIEQLSESARRMSLGDLEQKVEAPAGAVEFRELAGTLERMRVSQRVLLRQDRAG
jgi:HAMP domain-containing protein